MIAPFSLDILWAFAQVVLIDLVMAADNAIVVGMAAAGLPRDSRHKVILWGVIFATILRILFAALAVELMKFIGLIFAGGLLLLWVAWKMWRQLHQAHHASSHSQVTLPKHPKSFQAAVMTIVLADVSMSLDNVLAVAGAARDHVWVMVFGLMFSVVLMGVAATWVAKLIHRYRALGYIGLFIVTYVALDMTYRGAVQLHKAFVVA